MRDRGKRTGGRRPGGRGKPPTATVRRVLRRLDEALMRRASSGRSQRVDRVLIGITQAASYSRLWLLIAAALAMVGGRGRTAACRGVGAIAIASALVNGPAKLLVRRRRPPVGARSVLIRMPRSTSFPSGHSASAFAFATGVGLELPLVAAAIVPLAGAVAYSRVHTGVHYPSDVAAGAAVGVGCGLLAARLPCPREHLPPPP